ncbi:MAG: DNA adenine methylase [Myxococcota bacterium]
MVAVATETTPLAAPFLKWAGGKTQLLAHILPALPGRMNTYYEPFIGGGAVFFALANARRFRRAVISDANADLVEVYRTVRNRVEDLIDVLHGHAAYATDSDYYYEVRGWDVTDRSPVERAARLIFLNRTCFNGLYRVNKQGRFNVPFGRYKKPRVVNEEGLRSASLALQRATIRQGDFETTTRDAKAGDAVYFDPPYVPLSDSSSFTSYHKSAFGPQEHDRLLDVYLDCMQRGVASVLSNSDCPETRKLYRGLRIKTVQASRAINSVASKRGRINEVLVLGRTTRRVNTAKAKAALEEASRDSALPASRSRLRRIA